MPEKKSSRLPGNRTSVGGVHQVARFKADAPEFEVAMPTSRLFSLFAGVCPALLVLALLPVEATGASPWSLGISAGAADRYTYHDQDKYGWGTHFGYPWTASLGTSPCRWTPTISATTGVCRSAPLAPAAAWAGYSLRSFHRAVTWGVSGSVTSLAPKGPWLQAGLWVQRSRIESPRLGSFESAPCYKRPILA
jgi:hypothetical protein